MKHILDIVDLTTQEIGELIETAEDIAAHGEKYREACKGKKLATLFFEPSTRTRMSFEAAMIELGGNVICCTDIKTSSLAKGESVGDTVRVVSGYADVIAMRHPCDGAAYVAAMKSSIPVINAGDGGHCHPTQTLADILTIHRETGRLDNLTIGICGDLKYGRTVHSLINAMIRYAGIKFIFISPRELRLPDYVKETLEEANADFKEADSLEEVLPALDVLYMTRVQRERFDNADVYERVKDCYVLTREKMALAKEKMTVLHPLPRVNEISQAVDDDPRAAYFRQTFNGKLMRMALILKVLSAGGGAFSAPRTVGGGECANKKCISHFEQELPPAYVKVSGKETYKCLYCETVQNPGNIEG